MSEYYAIRWADENCAERYTREVKMNCRIYDDGKSILLTGSGDCEHHLLEDAAILLKKMCDKKCGEHSI